jgi:hypothetical protein
VSHNFYQNDPVVRSDLAGTCSKEYGEEVDPDVDSDLRSTVLVYRSESQAREALGKLAQDRAETMDQREGLAASLGDEAFAFHKQQNVGPWRISYCSVLWREGNTVGEVYFSASPAKAKMEVAEALARKVETRLK